MVQAFVGCFGRRDGADPIKFGPFVVAGSPQEFAYRGEGAQVRGRYVSFSSPDTVEGGLFCGRLANAGSLARLLVERGLLAAPTDDPVALVRSAHAAYGSDAPRLFEGLFTGVIWGDRQIVLFASKTAGPTLYFQVDARENTGWFASELKALPRERRRLRPFAALQADGPEERARNTCLDGVFRVRPGHVVEIAMAGTLEVRERAYYSIHRSVLALSEDEAAAQVRRVVDAAVRAVPGSTANCLVSGGLDSSIVAAIALERFDSVRLFSLGSEERNEFEAVRAFTRRFGVSFEPVRIDGEDFIKALPELVYMLEHPHSTFLEYLLPVHLGHRAVGRSADVLLSGYGSDVLFAGFARPAQTLAEVVQLVADEYASTAWSNEASQVLGGRFGIEIAYPFFDSSVVDMSFAIDPYWKHARGTEKYILRKAFTDLLGPEIAFRPKVGVHQGTGSEDWLSSLLPGAEQDALRTTKDRLCYEVLRETLVDGVRPSDLDLRGLVPRVLGRTDRIGHEEARK